MGQSKENWGRFSGLSRLRMILRPFLSWLQPQHLLGEAAGGVAGCTGGTGCVVERAYMLVGYELD
jgi:hypothetical protein